MERDKTHEKSHIVSNLLIIAVGDTNLTDELGREREDDLRCERLCELQEEDEPKLSPRDRCLFPLCLTLLARSQKRRLLIRWPCRRHRQRSLAGVDDEYGPEVVVVVVNRGSFSDSWRGDIEFFGLRECTERTV